MLVLTTSWDDKYFLYSYEDVHIRQLASEDAAYRPRSAKEAFASVVKQAEHCRRMETPLVLNIHPCHTIGGGQEQFYELKRIIVEWCASEEVPILCCRDYLEMAGLTP